MLAKHVPDAQVTLAGPNEAAGEMPKDAPYRYVRWHTSNVLGLVRDHDIIISSGFPPHLAAFWRPIGLPGKSHLRAPKPKRAARS